jgi:uncharacterized protein
MADPHFIDPDCFTPKGTSFEGVLRPGELENLEPELASPEGELRYRVTARLDHARRRVVSCIIDGFVFLTCQSTFEAYRHEVAIDDRLVLVGSEGELPPFENESDEEDFVVATSPIEVRALVEEAVILALPMVPRKPGAESGSDDGLEKPVKPTPFAALADLKRPKPK